MSNSPFTSADFRKYPFHLEYLGRLTVEKHSEIISFGPIFILYSASAWWARNRCFNKLTWSVSFCVEVWHTRPGGLFSTKTPRSMYRGTFDQATRDVSWVNGGIKSQKHQKTS